MGSNERHQAQNLRKRYAATFGVRPERVVIDEHATDEHCSVYGVGDDGVILDGLPVWSTGGSPASRETCRTIGLGWRKRGKEPS